MSILHQSRGEKQKSVVADSGTIINQKIARNLAGMTE